MNPNPRTDQLTPFEPGQSGNPGGKTSAQRKLEVENAEKATRIRAKLLDQVIELIEAGDKIEIEGNVLKLVKDSEDRGLGAPKEQVSLVVPIASSEPSDDEWAAEHGAD